jgi:Uma2 family endonuclease
MTAEEFWRLPESVKRRSLVRGEVVETMPPGGLHGVIALRLGACLEAWTRSGPGGVAGVESGFLLARNPDIVRAPDVFYVGPDRAPDAGVPEAFWEAAPDLTVEVVSPGEGADDVREKVRDYLAAGTRLVWVVYPRTREVVVHTPDGLSRAYGEGDTLEAFDALQGFTCAVADLFD